MTRAEKFYSGLCAFFCVLLVLGNLTYQKFVSLPIPLFYTFELSVGAILYPLTFLITDLIAEFYGKEKATFCVRFALFVNTLIALIIVFMDFLPATSWSHIDDSTFHHVFGAYSTAFIGSMIACYIAQALDVFLYLWIRQATQGKYLWLRSTGSTALSLFLDTFLVNAFLSQFKILPEDQLWPIIINSYSWKFFFVICSTPLFYGCVSAIRTMSNQQPLRKLSEVG